MLGKLEMTVREAGRRGGEAVKAKYGLDFYSSIGKKGGDAVAQQRGHEFYSAIGKMGGETVKQRHGSDFFSAIGKKGGDSVKASHGTAYYSAIGKKGGGSSGRVRAGRVAQTHLAGRLVTKRVGEDKKGGDDATAILDGSRRYGP